ncbi:MAG: GDP-L-fucose synthase [Verrucomicrobia bacterium]|nr:GDP-L-fucose synthase [Verrucomicrobiota bacterium]
MKLERHTPIFVAGHRGLAGSAIVRELQRREIGRLLLRTRSELDLTDVGAVERFFENEKPAVVVIAAAKVGGIQANDSLPGDFLFQNLQIQNNLIDASRRHRVGKLLFLGSSCVYPKQCPQPMKEDHLLTGPVETTSQWYAVAKLAGIKLCQAYRRQHGCDFITAMPASLYGPNDNFDPKASHVLPAMIRRFYEAKAAGLDEVVCWGTGSPLREFLHADDFARGCLLLLESYSDEQIINMGSGEEVSIRVLAEMTARAVGFEGRIRWDTSKPDGTPRKFLDGSRLFSLGWKPCIPLEQGLAEAARGFKP